MHLHYILIVNIAIVFCEILQPRFIISLHKLTFSSFGIIIRRSLVQIQPPTKTKLRGAIMLPSNI